jgi:hypothetical protein
MSLKQLLKEDLATHFTRLSVTTLMILPTLLVLLVSFHVTSHLIVALPSSKQLLLREMINSQVSVLSCLV